MIVEIIELLRWKYHIIKQLKSLQAKADTRILNVSK